MNSLQLGQTCEISNAYVGMTDKLPTHVIVHRLTKEQQTITRLNYKRKRKVRSVLLVINELATSIYTYIY
ncbi:hypothetical protein ABH948_003560 [Bacillus sp. RC218]